MNEGSCSFPHQMESKPPISCPFNYDRIILRPYLTPGTVRKIAFRENGDDDFSLEVKVLAVNDPMTLNPDGYVIDSSYIGNKHQIEGFDDSFCQTVKSFKVKWDKDLACYRRPEPNEIVVIKISNTRNNAIMAEIATNQYLGQFRKKHFEVAIIIDTQNYAGICLTGNVFLVSMYYEDVKIPMIPSQLIQETQATQQRRESQAQFIFYNIMNELRDFEAAGVCHFDISLENLKRTANGSYILVGHSHAKRVSSDFEQDSMPQDETMAGRRSRRQKFVVCEAAQITPYMPPEMIFQQQNQSFVVDGPSVDLWAACVVLFSILAGFVPGTNPSISPIGYIAGNDPAYLSSILNELRASYGVKDLLRKVFQKDPSKRPHLYEVLDHQWVAAARYFPLNPNSRDEPTINDEDFQNFLSTFATTDDSHKIRAFREMDVLSGRGSIANNHPGNIFWRGVCDEFLLEFIKTPKNDKKAIADKILSEVRSRNPDMLFLRKEGDHWVIEDDEKVLRKTMQRLREKAAEARAGVGGSFKGTGIKQTARNV